MVAVLGAGVIGLSTALRLAHELPGASITLIAEKFDMETTSSGAAGLWEPYKLSNTPPELVRQWGADTFAVLQRYLMSSEAASAGVAQATAYQFWTEAGHEDPKWADIVPHFRHMRAKEIEPYNLAAGGKIKQAWAFTTLICEGALHLRWLQEQLRLAGVHILRKKVTSLEELKGYDLVVNCTGLGARTLFGDTSMYPIRGHVIRVHAPWIKSIYFMDEQTYVIPNSQTVVLGGTGYVGDYSIEPTAEDRNAIWQGCLQLVPSLAEAQTVREWVGLRPGRPCVRLETEMMNVTGRGSPLPVVHNYGHGGAGLTLAHGCAAHATRLARELLEQQSARAKL